MQGLDRGSTIAHNTHMNKIFEVIYSEPYSDAKDILTIEARNTADARLLAICLFDGEIKIHNVREKPYA